MPRKKPQIESFNTQPPEGGWEKIQVLKIRLTLFQHTAARRRLVAGIPSKTGRHSFNTQPPEGGWKMGVFRFG